MKKIYNVFTLLLVALFGLSMTGCSNDDLNTNQFQNEVALNVYGPNPVVRGGTLRFIGSNLDQVEQIIIPGIGAVTNFEVVKSGIPSEIRVVIPKDGPIVGTVKLVTKTGKEIETQTQLTYTEGIEFDSFSPESAMPGEVITIEGDYLNLIHMVEFTDAVLVGEDDFVEHDRYTIKVKVPEEARTGKIRLYDVDFTKVNPADNDVSFNIIESEKALNVGTPTIASLASPRGDAQALGTVVVKQGETITVKGNNFNLVAGVIAGDIEIKEFTNDGKTITFVVPAEVPDGSVVLVCKSGVEVPVGDIETLLPSDLAVSPEPVKNGADLTVTGKDMDVVVSVSFPNVADAVAVEATATAVTVAVPEAAQEGDIFLNMANGKKIATPYTLVKPTVTAYSANPVSAGGALTIEGTDLDLVKTVAFIGNETPADVTVAADGKSMTLTVPMDSQSGKVTLNLKNGTAVEVAEINVEEAVFCYATVLPTPEDEIHAGAICTLVVKNVDVLTGVEINGVTCQYIVSGDNLIIGVPDNAKKGSKVRLISSNGEITYTVDFIPNTEITTVIWQGLFECSGWSGNQDLAWGAFDWSSVTPGTTLTLTYTKINADAWGCMSLRHGQSWGNLPNPPVPGQYDFTDASGTIVVELTQEILDDLIANNGLVVTGDNYVMSKITLTEHIVLEETLWNGTFDQDNWTNWEVGKGNYGDTNPNMFIEAGVKVGSTIRVYATPKADWWQFQLFDGHWTGMACLGDATGLGNGNNINAGIYDLSCGYIEIPVNAAMLEVLQLTDWGSAWIIQCENLVITKITIE